MLSSGCVELQEIANENENCGERGRRTSLQLTLAQFTVSIGTGETSRLYQTVKQYTTAS